MTKRLAQFVAFLLFICSMQLPARPEQAVVESPNWVIGDSWSVKCPVYTCTERDIKVSGYYTLVVQVLAEEIVRGTPCHVLKISSQPDYAKTGEADTHYESYVYYRKTDLGIRRIRTDLWRGERLTKSDDYGWLGGTTFGLDVTYPTMPILMPRFPIASGRSIVRQRRDFAQEKTGSGGGALASGDDGNRVLSATVSEVSTADESPESGSGLTPSSRSMPKGITVRFMQSDLYSRSGERETRRLTETWAPGGKWWTSARRGDLNRRNAGLYTLDESR